MNNTKLPEDFLVAPPEDRFEEEYSEKNRITAGVLAILLGTMGIHQFYLGNMKKGLLHLILLITGIGSLASTIWAIYEGILLFAGKPMKDGEGKTLL